MQGATKAWLCAVTAAATVLSACSSLPQGTVEPTPQNAKESGGTFNTGSVFGAEGINLKERVMGGGDSANDLPVNKYLWRGAIETLTFLPLASTDPYSGVIATEWGAAPEAPGERVRVTAYVKSQELTATALDVQVFKERLGTGGAWVSAPVAASTPDRLKDSILTRARELRIADLDAS